MLKTGRLWKQSRRPLASSRLVSKKDSYREIRTWQQKTKYSLKVFCPNYRIGPRSCLKFIGKRHCLHSWKTSFKDTILGVLGRGTLANPKRKWSRDQSIRTREEPLSQIFWIRLQSSPLKTLIFWEFLITFKTDQSPTSRKHLPKPVSRLNPRIKT